MPAADPRPVSGRSLVEISTAFHTPVTRRLLDYWQSKCDGRPRPRLSDLDLMDIYDVAPVLSIRDVVDGGAEFRSRYWGTRMRRNMGVETTGKLLSESFSPKSAAVLGDRLRLALSTEAPVRIVTVVDLVETRVPLTYEAVTLILDGDAADRRHTISAFGFGYEMRPGELQNTEGEADWRVVTYPKPYPKP